MRDIENEIRQALRRSPSFVTPGGLKYWPLIDAFNAIVTERDEAYQQAEQWRQNAIIWERRFNGVDL